MEKRREVGGWLEEPLAGTVPGESAGLISSNGSLRNRATLSPKELQWGEMGGHNLGEFLFFSYFRIVFLVFFGDYIIPKWLIKVPGPFQILFR